MTARMSATQARRARLDAHLLGGSDLSPTQVVTRAGAMQGQDLAGVLRAIAVRSRSGTTLDDVRAAFDAGELVRSWPMRGTLFVTTPEHLAATLHATAERLERADAKRREALGLSEAVVTRARAILLEALEERPRTRTEVLAAWEEAGIEAAGGRGYHLIAQLAVAGLAHWGAFTADGSEQLYTRTTPLTGHDPERGLVELVRSYVRARGPVTLADLVWWTKLPRSVLTPAVEQVTGLIEVEADGVPSWVLDEPVERPAVGVTLAPAFDEWILGYQDRSLVAGPQMLEALVPGRNGVFRPAILVDGRVVGTWRFPRGTRSTEPVVEMVEPVSASRERAIGRALAAWPYR